ncbi:xylulokinase [Alicyclobacillus hesperidum URH17-3-68]|uniref:Xylulose kinase n=2 Tax=Alicyclobacillus hesperidum TaxID=89784 RepID=A0A1H2Q708_9BACL|nr:xylulokinase [Alicyclobacillus hesperidum URH17-3-68]SDW02931.1 xylulokinase [Alicyclobacillus hesperidum]
MIAMATQSLLIGIDVGTSGVKVVLADLDGRTVAQSTRTYDVSQPQPLFAEQDPEIWWEQTCRALQDVFVKSGANPGNVRGIGLTGQMHSLVLLDEHGAVIRPAILWSDQRTQEQCDWIHSEIGLEKTIDLVANPALTNFTATKLLWVRQHEPEHYRRIRRVLLPKDYIRYRLTGEFASDVSDASGTLLLDVAGRKWSEEMCERLSIPLSWLPTVHESVEVTGRVHEKAAQATGLVAGTPVVAGAGDQAAGAIGNGIVRPGVVSSTIGTSGVVFAYAEGIVRDPKGRLHTFCHAVPGAWHVMGVTQAAGGSLQWYRNEFAQLERSTAELIGRDVYELLSDEAASVPPGSEGLVFLPYLMGERTPHLNPLARGVFFGITGRHRRAHFVRSIMEGVAFSLRDCLELITGLGLPVEQIRVSGGGARSEVWRSIQAGVFGQDVCTVEANEGPAFGAALLAGVGSGCFEDIVSACDARIRVHASDAPNPSHVPIYAKTYDVYRALYTSLQPHFVQK